MVGYGPCTNRLTEGPSHGWRDLVPGPMPRQANTAQGNTARASGLRFGSPDPAGRRDPAGPAPRLARAPDGGQVVHTRGLGLGPERAQLAAAAGDVDLRAPAVPVRAHAAELRALGGRARAQLRRQRRVRRLACARGGPASRTRQPRPLSAASRTHSTAASAARAAWPHPGATVLTAPTPFAVTLGQNLWRQALCAPLACFGRSDARHRMGHARMPCCCLKPRSMRGTGSSQTACVCVRFRWQAPCHAPLTPHQD